MSLVMRNANAAVLIWPSQQPHVVHIAVDKLCAQVLPSACGVNHACHVYMVLC